MNLKKLIDGLDIEKTLRFQDVEISGIVYDSRAVKENYLFVCIKGLRKDGHNFVHEAVDNGAVAIFTEREIGYERPIPQMLVKNSRAILSQLSGRFYLHPSGRLYVTGVTGTDGKTTTCYLLRAVAEAAGKKTALLGTIDYEWAGRRLPSSRTTPEAPQLQSMMNQMLGEGISHLFMEVSSHALVQRRVDDVQFKSAVFTNISAEHLDYHKTPRAYLEAKEILFERLSPDGLGIINIDDDASAHVIGKCRGRLLTYGLGSNAAVCADSINLDMGGISFNVSTPCGGFSVRMRLLGRVNVYNALAAVAFGVGEGYPLDVIKRALEGVGRVEGRFEIIESGKFTVMVDYAHTPSGLRNVLRTGREISSGKVIAVFGCGGDRDVSKRQVMAQISSSESDYTILTSDNPRGEDPLEILSQMEEGFKKEGKVNYCVIVDRFEAIKNALDRADTGDLVIIAGKGHENYQILSDTVIPFNDSDVVKRLLSNG